MLKQQQHAVNGKCGIACHVLIHCLSLDLVAALGRGLFVKYRFTDRRISVVTNAPWQSELSSFVCMWQ